MIEGIWNLFNFNSDPPMTRFVASQLAHDHWFSTAAAQKDLGYQPSDQYVTGDAKDPALVKKFVRR